jgi:hypothetical protein
MMTEQRRNQGSQGRHTFAPKYNALSKIDFDRLWNFYRLCKGKYKTFYFQNPEDAIDGPLLPYDQVTVWVPLFEGSGLKFDDLNGYLFPIYSCRFADDKMDKQHFTEAIYETGLQIIQESNLIFTNNYGTLAGTYTWVQLYDGTVAVIFDGASGYCSFGDAAALNVGTGDFSLALCVYPDTLADAKPIITKKSDNLVGTDGWALLMNENGSMDFYFSDGVTLKQITSATGALVENTWAVVFVTMDRDGNGQIYVNNAVSGAAVDISGSNLDADCTTAAYIGRQSAAYGNVGGRNFMFAKKVWDSTERGLLWSYFRETFGI